MKFHAYIVTHPEREMFVGDEHTHCSAAILTNEHPSSSYGIPVVVRHDGEVFGPADIPGALQPVACSDADLPEWLAFAKLGKFTVEL
jgi:hypothetical protein